MAKKIVATVEMIRGYKHRPTNYWLAISEFIDNSIASYQNKNDKYPIDGLQIKITFDWRDENNKQIIIQDNANGMDRDELENAIQPCDRKGKSDEQYNQYGVGMKLGAFWYGENLAIFSKRKDDKEYKLELNTHNKTNEEIIVDAEKSKEAMIYGESGTYIKISKVYDEREIVNQKGKFDELKNAIGWRYNKLINKGLKIYVEIKHHDIKKRKYEELIDAFSNRPFNLEEFISRTSRSINDKQKSDEFYQKIRRLEKDVIEKIRYSEDKYDQLLVDMFDKTLHFQNVECEIPIIVNNKEVNLKVCLMSNITKNKNKYSGVTIYHVDRAIIHGPNDQNNKVTCKQFHYQGIGSGGNPVWRWLYGELNLTGIEVPDENKSTFLWSATGEEDLNNELAKIFDKLKPFLKIITEVNDIKSNKPSASIFNNIAEEMNNDKKIKSMSNLKYDEKKECIIGDCIIGENDWGIDGNYKVEIYEEDINNFLMTEHDKQNKIIKIIINREEKFWKPYIAQHQSFKPKILYPIALYLGIADIFNEKIKQSSDKTFIQIMGRLLKEWTN